VPLHLAIEPFAQIQREWSELAKACPDATIYQRDRWLKALNLSYRFDLRAATLRDLDGRLAAACLFARSKNPFARRWTSLPCSDSAPPLARDEQARQQLLLDLAAAPFASRSLLEIRGCAAPQPWKQASCFAEWRLDLSRPFKAIERTMAPNFRRQLNRGNERSFAIDAHRGISGMKRFYGLMLETRRRLGLPAQPWSFFRAVHEAFASENNVEVWTISQDGHALAAMVMLADGPEIHYKWSARLDPTPPGATHRLLAAILEKYAQQFLFMNLGRTDVRNTGLSRFKKEMGAAAYPMPYSFLPEVPAQVSPEVLDESRLLLSRIWRRLPMPLTRLLGSALYRYLV
jgi:hypothetical protein